MGHEFLMEYFYFIRKLFHLILKIKSKKNICVLIEFKYISFFILIVILIVIIILVYTENIFRANSMKYKFLKDIIDIIII